MTSQVNPSLIQTSYPVAGIDNSTQGFRDNFNNTALNFQYCAQELSDLQNKVVLKAALAGQLLNNNMNGALLSNVLAQDFAATAVQHGTLSGTVTCDYAAGHFQTVTTNGAINLTVTNWPVAGEFGWLIVEVTVNTATDTIAFPSGTSGDGIVGYNTNLGVCQVPGVGIYRFLLTSAAGGATFTLTTQSNLLQPLNASAEDLSAGGLANAIVTTSWANAATPVVVQVAAGVEGQTKILALTGNVGGGMTATVASTGWNLGGTGTVTLTDTGSTCMLRVVDGLWYVIGNTGAVIG